MSSAKRFLFSLLAGAGLLAAMLGAVAASGQPDRAPGDPQLLVVPATPKGTATLERSDARTVARYEAFTLVEASGGDAARLRSAGADRRDDMHQVRLAGEPFDPARDRTSLAAKRAVARAGLALIQFVGPVKERWLELLRATGVRIVGYQAENAYLVHGGARELEALAGLLGRDPAARAAVPVEPADKLEGDAGKAGTRRVALYTVPGEPGESARRRAAGAGRELRGQSAVGGLRTQYLALDGAQAAALARDQGVVAVEPYAKPELRDERAAQIVAGNLSVGTPDPPGYLPFLTTEGFGPGTFDFGIDITDEGLDRGSTSTVHPDFSGRVDYVTDWTGDPDGTDCGGHGTNVASIAAGLNTGTDSVGTTAVEDSSGYNYGLGVAPFALIGASKIFDCAGNFDLAGNKDLSDLTSSAYANGSRVSSNSWGSSDFGAYGADAREYDALVRDAQPTGSDFAAAGNQQLVEVFAAGNDGDGNSGSSNEGYASVGSPGTAKNVITVGASESVRPFGGTDGCGVPDSGANDARDIIDFSSRGPTDDGRLKPDIVAPGTHVTGASPQHAAFNGSGTCNEQFPAGNTLYSIVSGTSQATPEVSGAAGLVRDWYRREQGGGTVTPSPALTKAILLNTATDIAGGDSGKGSTIGGVPNTDQGWGRVDIGEVLSATPREFRDQSDLLSASGASLVRSYEVQNTGQPLKVTLAWTDPVGPASGNAFVNNLDLVVGAGGTTYKGNVLAGGQSIAGGSADSRNNVESVYLPAGTSGRFSVKVVGTAVSGDGVPGNGDATDQDFALVVSNAAEQASPVLVHDQTTFDDSTGGNGNAELEPGEGFRLDERIANSGDSGATGISGTLASGSAGLSVTQPSSAYPNVGTGATGTNTTPYEGSLSAAATCGSDVQLTLDLTTAQGAQSVPVTLGTGSAGAPTTRSSLDIPKLIPDDDAAGVASTLNVPTGGRIKDIDVRISGISHTWVGDLKLELTGPDGTTVVLAEHPGGPDNGGNNFTNTVFDDEAAGSISAGAAPYTGSFRPQADQLSRFDGKDQQGTWTLRVRDLFESDNGTLTGWGTDIRTAQCSTDLDPPETAIDSGPSGTVASTTADFTFSSDEPGSSFECKLDSGSFAPCSASQQYTGLAQGAHSLEVKARDPAGNLDPSAAVANWSVDTVAPAVTLSSPASGSATSDTTPALSGVGGLAAGDNATVTVKVWAGPNTSGTLLQTHTPTRDGTTGAFSVAASTLPEGTYTARSEQQDAVGNTGLSATRTFTVDTTAPALSLTSPPDGSTLTGGSPALAGVAGILAGDSASVTIQVFQGSDTLGPLVQTRTASRSATTGAYSTVASPALANGTYTARARQQDVAGNMGFSGETTFTIAAAPDTDPPETTITSGPSGTLTSRSATFAFAADEPGSGFQCKLDAGSFGSCASPRTYSGLSAGVHTFQVRARDASGNLDSSPAMRRWTVAASDGSGSPPAPLAWALQPAELDRGTTLAKGIPVLVGCDKACSVRVRVTLPSGASATAGRARAELSAAGSKRVSVRLKRSARRRIRRKKTTRLRLRTVVVQDDTTVSLSRRLTLRRRGTRRRAVRRGLRVALRCSAACGLDLRAYVSGSTAGALGLQTSARRLAGSRSAELSAAGTLATRLRLIRAVRVGASRVAKLRLSLVAKVTGPSGATRGSTLRLLLRR